jgi:TatD DNase family protein
MIVDIGVNLLNRQFQSDQDAVIERARAAGVGGMLITATDLNTTKSAIARCSSPDLFCTAGIHPHDAGRADSASSADEDWLEQLASLAQSTVVRAVGETGLDFNRNYSPANIQIDFFRRQIELAQQINKPLFVHDRDSEGEVFKQLQLAGLLPPVVIHCFTGNAVELDQYLAADYYIGVTGWITDPRRGATLAELVTKIPLNRLLIETDAPFLRPHNTPTTFISEHNLPAKRKRRNEPALLPYVLDKLALHRRETKTEIAAATTANASRLFGFNLV